MTKHANQIAMCLVAVIVEGSGILNCLKDEAGGAIMWTFEKKIAFIFGHNGVPVYVQGDSQIARLYLWTEIAVK